jgi:hypothetical protein
MKIACKVIHKFYQQTTAGNTCVGATEKHILFKVLQRFSTESGATITTSF